MTGPPGQYVRLASEETYPGAEQPSFRPVVSGSGLYALAHLFGLGEPSTPLLGTGGCGTIEHASLEDAIDGVINARV
ncbi:uncharacterized protein SOCEGT47_038440 [Sorangium cellulosum]|uniref:Uncharacterized protein n=1 Tax=Sorangium cellulosum TaxID=56 RepID=A0A4P2Q2I5_SORCE|nr:hypothetical protein [Sorangium cellulosum]AUX23321.1 uncharacterized protein SOCEGT47_038440 [Sorangium cellulosum]